ncbi:MAG: hypothetical protein QF415_09690 [Candidatus Undinarchaeales archaeon]|nr:hypothetical protein [Candidatus Undinarchaeales archaeon]
MPTGTALTSKSLDDANIGDYSASAFTEVDFEFDTPTVVRAGHLYAIVLEADSCDSSHEYRWHSACGFSDTTCYTRGDKSRDTGSGWGQDSFTDKQNPHFIVYIGNNLTQLSTGVDYALMAYSPVSADADNSYLISKADSNAYSDGTYVGSTDGGSAWTADSAKDMTFRIYRQFLLVPQDDTIQGELPTTLEGSTSSNDAVCIFSSAADTPCNSTATSKCHSDAIGYVTEPAENGSGNDYSVTIDESSNGIYHIYYCDGGTEALHIIETHTSKEANTVTVNVAAVKGEAHSELETAGVVDVFDDLAATAQVDTATQSITSSGGDDYTAYFRSNATDGKYYLRTTSTVSTKVYVGYVFFSSGNGTTTTVDLDILTYGQVPTAITTSGSVWMDDEADETDDTLYRGAITNTGSGYKYRFYHDGTTPMYLKADTDATHTSPVLEEQKTVSSDTEWNVAVLTGNVPTSLVGDTIEVHTGTGDACGASVVNSATVVSGGSYGTYSVYLLPDASARYLYACESSTKVYYGSATIDDAGESVSFSIQGIHGDIHNDLATTSNYIAACSDLGGSALNTVNTNAQTYDGGSTYVYFQSTGTPDLVITSSSGSCAQANVVAAILDVTLDTSDYVNELQPNVKYTGDLTGTFGAGTVLVTATTNSGTGCSMTPWIAKGTVDTNVNEDTDDYRVYVQSGTSVYISFCKSSGPNAKLLMTTKSPSAGGDVNLEVGEVSGDLHADLDSASLYMLVCDDVGGNLISSFTRTAADYDDTLAQYFETTATSTPDFLISTSSSSCAATNIRSVKRNAAVEGDLTHTFTVATKVYGDVPSALASGKLLAFTSTGKGCTDTTDLAARNTTVSSVTVDNDVSVHLTASSTYYLVWCTSGDAKVLEYQITPSSDTSVDAASFGGDAHADLATGSYHGVACTDIGGTALSSEDVTGTQYDSSTKVYYADTGGTPDLIISTSAGSCAAANLVAASLDVSAPASFVSTFNPDTKVYGEVPAALASKTVKVYASNLDCSSAATVARGTLPADPVGGSNDAAVYMQSGGTTYYVNYCDGTTTLLERTEQHGSSGAYTLHVGRITGNLHDSLTSGDYIVVCSDIDGSALNSESVTVGTYDISGAQYYEATGTPDFFISSGSATDCTEANMVTSVHDVTIDTSDYLNGFHPDIKVSGDVPSTLGSGYIKAFTGEPYACGSSGYWGKGAIAASVAGSGDYDLFLESGRSYYFTVCTSSNSYSLRRQKDLSSVADVDFDVGIFSATLHSDIANSTYHITMCDNVAGSALSSKDVDGGAINTSPVYYDATPTIAGTPDLVVGRSAASCAATNVVAAAIDNNIDTSDYANSVTIQAKFSGEVPASMGGKTIQVFNSTQNCGATNDLVTYNTLHSNPTGISNDMMVYLQNGTGNNYHVAFCDSTTKLYNRAADDPSGNSTFSIAEFTGTAHAELANASYHVVACNGIGGSALSTRDVTGTQYNAGTRVYFESIATPEVIISTSALSCAATNLKAAKLDVTVPATLSASFSPGMKLYGEVPGSLASKTIKVFTSDLGCSGTALVAQHTLHASPLGITNDTVLYVEQGGTTYHVAFCDGSTNLLRRTRSEGSAGYSALHVAKVTGSLHADLAGAAYKVVACSDVGGSLLSSESVSTSTFNGGGALYFESTSGTPDVVITSSTDCTASVLVAASLDTTPSSSDYAVTFSPTAKMHGEVPASLAEKTVRVFTSDAGCLSDATKARQTLPSSVTGSDDLAVYVVQGPTYYMTLCDGSTKRLVRTKAVSSTDVTFSVGGVNTSATGKVHTDLEDSSHYIVACDAISGNLLSSESVTGAAFDSGYQYYEVSADDSSVVLAVSSSASSCATTGLSAARTESDMDRGEEVTFDPEAKGSGDIPNDNPTVRVFLTDPGTGACDASGQLYASSDTSTDSSQTNADYSIYGQNGITYYVVFCDGTSRALETSTSSIGTADIDVGRLQGEVHADLRSGDDAISVHSANDCASMVSSETINPTAGTPDYRIWFEDTTGGTYYVRTVVDSTYTQCGHAFTLTSQAKVQNTEGKVSGTVPSGVLRAGLDYDSNGDDAWTTSFSSSAYRLYGDSADTSVLVHAYEDTGGSTEVLERTRNINSGDKTFDVAKVTAGEALHDDLDDADDHLVVCTLPGGSVLASEDITGTSYEGGNTLYFDATSQTTVYFGSSSASLDCTGSTLLTATKQTSVSAGGHYRYIPKYKLTGDVPTGVDRALLFSAIGKGCSDVDGDMAGYDGTLVEGQSDNDYDLYVNKTDGSTFRLVFCNGGTRRLQSVAQSSISAAVDVDVARVASGGASKVHDDLNSQFIVACTAPDGVVLTSESVTGTSYEGGSTYQYFEVTQSTAYFVVSGSASSCSATGLSAGIKLSVAGGSDYTFAPEAKGAGDIPEGNPSVRMFVDDPGTGACGGSQIYVSSDSTTDSSQINADYAVYGQNGATYYVVFCNGTTKALETSTTSIGTADIDVGRLHGEVHADLRTGSNDVIEVHNTIGCASAVSSETVNPTSAAPDYYIWFEDTGSPFYVRTSVDSGQYVQCGHAFTLTAQASTQDLETLAAGTMPSGVLRVGLDYDSNGDDTWTTTFQSSAFKLFGDNADSAVLVHAYEDTGGSTEVLERTRDLTAGDRTFDVARITTPQNIHDDLDDTSDYVVACSAPGGSALVSESINGATFEGGSGNGDVLYVDVTGISDMYLAITSSSLSCTGTNIITATKQSSLSGGSGYAYTPLYKVTGDVPSGPTYAKLFAAASKGCTDVDADLRGYDGSMTTAQTANDYDLYVNKTDSSTFYAVFCDGSNNRLFEASGRTVSGATTIHLGKVAGETHTDLEDSGTADNVEVFSDSSCTSEVSRHDIQPAASGGDDYTVYFETTVSTFYLKATKDAGANAQCGLGFTLTSQAAAVQLNTKASGTVPSTVTSVGIDYGKTGSDDLVSKGSLSGSYALYGDSVQTSLDVHVYDSGGEVLESPKSLAIDFVLDVAKVKSSGPIHGDLADGNHYALACKSPGSTKLNSKVVSGLNFNDGDTDLYFEKDGSQVFFTISTASDGCQVTAINSTTPQSSVTGGTTYYYTPSRRFSGKIPLGPTHVRLFSTSGQSCTTGGLNFRGYDGGVSHGTSSDYTLYTNETTSETFYVLFCDWSNTLLLESAGKSVPDDLALSLARVGGTVHSDLTSKNIVACSAIGDSGTRISSASVSGTQFNGGTYQYYEPSGSSVYFAVSSSSSSCASSDLSAAVSTTVAAGDTDTFTATDKATGDITANNPTVRMFIGNPDTSACQSSGQSYVSSDTSTDSSQSNADYAVYGHDGQSYYMVFCEGSTVLYESALITDVATADIDIARVHTSGVNKVHADIKGSTSVVICSAVGDSGASISTTELAASSYDNGGTSYMYFEVPGSGDVYFALSTSGTSCASSNLRAGIKRSVTPGATVTFDPTGKLKGDIPSDDPSVRVFTEDPGSSACLASGQDYIAADTSTDYTQSDADYAVYGQDGDTYYIVYCDGTSKGVQTSVSTLAQAGTDLDVGKVSGNAHSSLETPGDGNDRVDVYSDSTCTTKVSSETVQPNDGNNPDYSVLFMDTTGGTYYIKTTVVASGKTYDACGTPFTLTSQTKTDHHLTARVSGTVPIDVPHIGLDYDDNGDETYTTTLQDQVYMLFGDAADTQVRVHAYEDINGTTEVLERIKSLAGGTVGFDVAKVRALEAAIHDDLDDSGDHVVVCTAPGGSTLVSEDITGTAFEGVSGDILYFDATSLSEAYLTISSGALDCSATNLATATRLASPTGGSGYQFTPLYKVTGDIPAGISYVKLFSSVSQACTAASTTLRGYDGALLTGQSANDYDLYVNKTEGTTLYAVFCDASNVRLFEASSRTVSGNLALHIGKISGEAHSDLENAGTADNVEVFTGATCTSEVSRHDTQPTENGSGVDYTVWFESTGASPFYVKVTKDTGANVQCGHSVSLTSQAATVPLHGKVAGSVQTDVLKMGLDHDRDGTDEVRTSSTLSGAYAIYGDGSDSQVDVHAYLTGDVEALERLNDLTSAVTFNIARLTAETHTHLDDDGSILVYATSTCTEARSASTDASDSGGADVTVYFDSTGASTFYLKAATSTNSTCGNAISPDGNREATADLTGAITGTVHTDITVVSVDLDEGGGAEGSTSVVSGGYALYTNGSDTSLTVSFNTTGGTVLSRTGKNLSGAAGKNLDVDAGRLTGDVHTDLRTGGNDVVEVYDDSTCASKVSSATVNPTAATPDYTIYFEDTGSNFYIKTSVDSTYVQCGHLFTLTSQAKVVDLTARVAGTVPGAINRIGLDQSRNGNDEAWTTTFSSGGYKLFGDAADASVDVHAYEDTSGATEVLERTRALTALDVAFDIVSIAAGGALHDDLDDASDHVVACSLPGGAALTSEDITGTAYEGGDTLYVDTTDVTDIYLTVTGSSYSCASSDLVTVTKQSSVTAGGTYGYRPLYKVTGDIPSSIDGTRLFTANGKACSDVDGTFAGYDSVIDSGQSANDYDLYVNATNSATFYVVYCTGSTRILESTSRSSISGNVAISVARISSGGSDKVSNDLNSANVLVCTAPGGTRISSEAVTGSSFDGGSTYQYFETSDGTVYAVLSGTTTSCASSDLQAGTKLTSITGGGSYTFSPSVFQSGDIPNDNPTVRLFIDDPGSGACGGSQAYVASDTSTDSGQSGLDYKVYGQDGETYYMVFCNGTDRVLEVSTSSLAAADIDVGRLQGEVHADLRTGSNDVIEVHDASSCGSAVSTETVNPAAGTPDYLVWFKDTGGPFYIRSSVDSTYVQCGHQFTLSAQAKVQDLETRIAGTVHADVLRMGLDYTTDGDDTWTTTFSSGAYKLFGDAADASVQVHAFTDTSGSTEVLERGKALTTDVTLNVGRLTGDTHGDLETGGNDIIEVHDASTCASGVSSATVNPSDAASPDYTIFFEDADGTLYIKTSVDGTYTQCGHAFTTTSRAKVQALTARVEGSVHSDVLRMGLDYAADADDTWTTSFSSGAYKLFGDATDTSVQIHAFTDTSGSTEVLERGKSLASDVTFNVGRLTGDTHGDLETGANDVIEVHDASTCTSAVSSATVNPSDGASPDYTIFFEDADGTLYIKTSVDGTYTQCGHAFTTTSRTKAQPLTAKVAGTVHADVLRIGLDYSTDGDDSWTTTFSSGAYRLFGDVADTSVLVHAYSDTSGSTEVLERGKSLASDVTFNVGRLTGDAHSDLETGGNDVVEVHDTSTCVSTVSSATVNPSDAASPDYTIFFEDAGGTLYVKTSMDGTYVQCGHAFTTTSRAGLQPLTAEISGTVPSDIKRIGLDYATDGDDVWTTTFSSSAYKLFGDATDTSVLAHAYEDTGGATEVLERSKSLAGVDVVFDISLVRALEDAIHADLDDTAHHIVACSVPGGSALVSEDITGQAFEGVTIGDRLYIDMSGISQLYLGVSTAALDCTATKLNTTTLLTGLQAGNSYQYTPLHKVTGDIPAGVSYVKLFATAGQACTAAGTTLRGYDGLPDASPSANDYDLYVNRTEGQDVYVVFCDGSDARLFESTAKSGITGDLAVHLGKVSGETHSDLEDTGTADNVEVFTENSCTTEVSRHDVQPTASAGTDYTVWFESTGTSAFYLKITKDAVVTQCGHGFTLSSQAATVELDGKASGTVHSDITRVGLDYAKDGTDNLWTTSTLSGSYAVYGDANYSPLYVHAYITGNVEVLEREKSITSDAVMNIARIASGGSGSVHDDLDSAKVIVCTAPDGSVLSTRDVAGSQYDAGSAHQYFEVTQATAFALVSSSTTSCTSADLRAGIKLTSLAGGQGLTFSPAVKGSGDLPADEPTVRVFLDDPGTGACGSGQAYLSSDTDTDPSQSDADYDVYGQNGVTYYLVFCNGTDRVLERSTSSLGSADIDVGRLQGEVHADLRNGGNDLIEVHTATACASAASTETVNPSLSTGPDYIIWFEDSGSTLYVKTSVDSATYVQCGHAFTTTAQAKVQDLETRVAGTVHADVKRMGLDYDSDGDDTWTTTLPSSLYRLYGDKIDVSVLTHAYEDTSGSTEVLKRTKALNAGDVVLDISRITGAVHTDLGGSQDKVRVYADGDCTQELSSDTSSYHYSSGTYRTFFEHTTTSGYYYLDARDADTGNVTRGLRVAASSIPASNVDLNVRLSGVVPDAVRTVAVDLANDGVTASGGDPWAVLVKGAYRLYGPADTTSQVRMWAESSPQSTAPLLQRARNLSADAILNVTTITGAVHGELTNSTDVVKVHASSAYDSELTNGTGSYHVSSSAYTVYLEDVHASGHYYLDVLDANSNNRTRGIRVAVDGTNDGAEATGVDLDVRLAGVVPAAFPSVALDLAKDGFTQTSGDPWTPDAKSSYVIFFGGDTDAYVLLYTTATPPGGTPPQLARSITKDTTFNVTTLTGTLHTDLVSSASDETLAVYGGDDYMNRLSAGKDTVQMAGSAYTVYFDDVHTTGNYYYLQVNDSKGNVTRGSRFVPDGALDGLEKSGLAITARLFGVVPPDVKTVSVDLAGDGTGPGDAYVNITDTTAPMTYAVYLPGTAWSVVHAHTGGHTSAPVLNRTRALPANSNVELNVTRVTGKMHADLIHANDTITAWGDANYTVEYTNGTTSYVPVNGTTPTYSTYLEDVLASGYYYLQVYEGTTKDATKGLRVVQFGFV